MSESHKYVKYMLKMVHKSVCKLSIIVSKREKQPVIKAKKSIRQKWASFSKEALLSLVKRVKTNFSSSLANEGKCNNNK